jgi:enoyl-CoA hydratase
MTKFETLTFEKIEDIGILKINRPKSLNALNLQVLKELDVAFDEIDTDRTLKVLIITGEGEKAFVAGADIVELSKLDSMGAQEFAKLGQGVFRRLEILKIPVIAAVNGFALGGGCELALACDFIYASENAKFGQPEVLLGLIPGFGGTQRLARFVGLPLARELIYSGEQITASRALEIGLVNKVLPLSQLLDEVLKTAKTITLSAPLAVAASKEAINDGFDVALDKGLGFEVDLFSDLFETDDVKEGTLAFVEKRKPVFKGE